MRMSFERSANLTMTDNDMKEMIQDFIRKKMNVDVKVLDVLGVGYSADGGWDVAVETEQEEVPSTDDSLMDRLQRELERNPIPPFIHSRTMPPTPRVFGPDIVYGDPNAQAKTVAQEDAKTSAKTNPEV